MKATLILLTLFCLNLSTALAFESGDKFRCYDDVSSAMYTVKIMDIGDEEAYVRIDATQDVDRFYPHQNVLMNINDEGATFTMYDDNENWMEEIVIEHNQIYGTYAERGDSRGIDCEKM